VRVQLLQLRASSQLAMHRLTASCAAPALPQSYFRARATLPRNYWLSATRNLTSGDFAWPDGTGISANITTSPYSHWCGLRGHWHTPCGCRAALQ
jgi:hypothetical protein